MSDTGTGGVKADIRVRIFLAAAILGTALGAAGQQPAAQAPQPQRTLFSEIPPDDAKRQIIQSVLSSSFYSMRSGFSSSEWTTGHYGGAWERAGQYFPNHVYYTSSQQHFMTHFFNPNGKLEMQIFDSAYLRLCVANQRTFTGSGVVGSYQGMLANDPGAAAAFQQKLGHLEAYFRTEGDKGRLKAMIGDKLFDRLLDELRRENHHMFAGALMHEGMHAEMDDDALVAAIQNEYSSCKLPVQWDELRAYMSEINYHSRFYNWAVNDSFASWREIDGLLRELEAWRKRPKPLSEADKQKIEAIKAKIKAYIALIRLRMREIWQSAQRMQGLMDSFRQDHLKPNAPAGHQDTVRAVAVAVADFVLRVGQEIQRQELLLRELESYLDLWNKWASCQNPSPPPAATAQDIIKRVRATRWPAPPSRQAEDLRKKAEEEIGKIPGSLPGPRPEQPGGRTGEGGRGRGGTICISLSDPYFDPLQMPWSGISPRRRPGGASPGGQPAPAVPGAQAASAAPPAGFAFQLPVREGDILKRRLLGNEKISVRARVESRAETADLENVVCHIPGTDPAAGEVILSAHLFEGLQKQGANDNISGSACILEVARVLHTLVAEGRLPRPKRTIRFIWGPEFSGIGEWVRNNRAVMERTLCNINMDMVGEWLSKNQAYFCLMRTTFGNAHYINDVMENYYRYIGEGSRERIQNRSTPAVVPVRVVAPSGADEPFAYSIETHYGASDHEVFNDWGVGVPGVMMIAWPDKWYHTSGDTADKSDPTQLKRAAAIGAAGAYTVASADGAAAARIAAEIAANATRRIGHLMNVAMETLNRAAPGTLAEDRKFARGILEAAVVNEKDTLASVIELAPSSPELAARVAKLSKAVEGVGAAARAAVEAHEAAVAGALGFEPGPPVLTDLEKKAARLVPRPTSKVRANGYRGYQALLGAVPAAERAKYPTAGPDFGVASTAELQLLVDGRHSALDIKKMLDAQHERRSSLRGVLNHLEILRLAGLAEW